MVLLRKYKTKLINYYPLTSILLPLFFFYHSNWHYYMTIFAQARKAISLTPICPYTQLLSFSFLNTLQFCPFLFIHNATTMARDTIISYLDNCNNRLTVLELFYNTLKMPFLYLKFFSISSLPLG